MAQLALGLLETRGISALVAGTDAMLKSANVSLAGPMKQVGSALVTAVVIGDAAKTVLPSLTTRTQASEVARSSRWMPGVSASEAGDCDSLGSSEGVATGSAAGVSSGVPVGAAASGAGEDVAAGGGVCDGVCTAETCCDLADVACVFCQRV